MLTEVAEVRAESLKSAKRGSKERTGVHAWHTYYAGFSEDFVESALSYLNCTPGMTVLDPWGGSGTTSLVASKNGILSISVDINPAISALSASKSFEVLKHRDDLSSFFAEVRSSSFSNKVAGDSAFDIELELRALVDSAARSFPKLSEKYKKVVLNYLRADAGDVPLSYPLAAFLQVAAFRLGRKSQRSESLSNPTWTKHRKAVDRDFDTLGDFEEIGRSMLSDLEAAYRERRGAQSIHLVGDSRRLPIATGIIDVIITSPPYLTRIDYAVSAAPELSLMNPVESLREIRLDTMGSPVIRRLPVVQKSSWGDKCNLFLNDVAAHESKAARSYYLKHMLQYFDDMEKSLSEIRRVLRRGGRALVVVQGSYFKEILCPLGDLYVEMARGVGLKAEIVFNDRVSWHMANLNKRSTKYQARKVYSEDFVQLTKR
ncbi:MAG: hypothetical protein EOP50_00425 [Sphingobacteriales bacterium]|nr:MAG: hypothetical protein EOP50_00425 [Sphingobacteriales bacterium]